MSLLSTVEATPSRMVGTFRYVLHAGPLSWDDVVDRQWPASTQSDASQLPARLRLEMVGLGLLEESEDTVRVSEALPDPVRASPEEAERHLPQTVLDLVLDGTERNADVAIALAWFLGLDPRVTRGQAAALDAIVQEDGLGDVVGEWPGARFGMLEDWAVYLGLGRVLPDPGQRTRLVPDPTACIRRALEDVLPVAAGAIPIDTFLERLAARIPVFEGGRYRSTVEARVERIGGAEAVSPATALALHRLHEEGALELQSPSDARVNRTLTFGSPSRVAYVTRPTPTS